jgi:hypothetical protein
MANLTPLQRTTLSDIGHGSVYQRKFGYAAWRIQGGSPTVVGRLISLGLAEWAPSDGDRRECQLTDAGRAASHPEISRLNEQVRG